MSLEFRTVRALPAMLAFLATSSCAARGDNDYRTRYRLSVGAGLACRYEGVIGPPSYRVSDLGRPGVPRLSSSERSLLQKIEKTVPSQRLRFAHLNDGFIVFPADQGRLCDPDAPPFIDLSARACNAYYPALYSPYYSKAAMGCVNPPRPWIPGDQGRGKMSWPSTVRLQP